MGAGKNFETKYRYQVDINTATPFELQTLPGIGETLANRIVEYREDSGPFESSEEIRNIKGIGEKKHATLLPYLLPFRAATVMKR